MKLTVPPGRDGTYEHIFHLACQQLGCQQLAIMFDKEDRKGPLAEVSRLFQCSEGARVSGPHAYTVCILRQCPVDCTQLCASICMQLALNGLRVRVHVCNVLERTVVAGSPGDWRGLSTRAGEVRQLCAYIACEQV